MKKWLKILAVACTVAAAALPSPSHALVKLTVGPSGYITSTCYTKADAEAEQALRLRSELMVIGLNCQASRYRGTDENLYGVYRQFVAVHGSQFAAYEKQMLDYFIRAGSTDPEHALGEMTASFGNSLSLGAAQTRPDMFCYQYSKHLLKVRKMNGDEFRQWVVSSYGMRPPTHEMCQ